MTGENGLRHVRAVVSRLASGVVLWGALALIGILAIPAGLLLAAIVLIWSAADAVIERLEQS